MATTAELFLREPYTPAPAARKLRGAVYTPMGLADWLAELLAEQDIGDGAAVVDFGCGEGALLEAAACALPTAQLFGVEVDGLAIARARRLLPRSASLIAADVLQPPRATGCDLAAYWRRRFEAAPQAVIMN